MKTTIPIALLGLLPLASHAAIIVTINNHSFETNRNTEQTLGGFANGESRDFGPNGTTTTVEAGDENRITGWTTVATENNTVAGAQVAVGFRDIEPADPVVGTIPKPQVLSLMAGSATAQVSTIAWSSLTVGHTITMTVAVGDRSTGSTWADKSFFGITDGLASGGIASGTMLSSTVANSGVITAPPTGIDIGTMDDLSVNYVIQANDLLRLGNLAVVLAGYGSTASGDGLTDVSGTLASANQAFFDNVRLTIIPEPSSAALLGGFGVLALLRRRRA